MESLKGFVRRHGKMGRKAFLASFTHPFLASPPPRGKAKDSSGDLPESLFPGAWVIPLKKKKSASLDTRISVGRGMQEDIWIDDASVSKEHCYFTRSGKEFQIADANSTNGTFVNGHALAPHVPRTLRSGDKVGIGEQIVFHFFPPEALYHMLFEKPKGDSKGK